MLQQGKGDQVTSGLYHSSTCGLWGTGPAPTSLHTGPRQPAPQEGRRNGKRTGRLSETPTLQHLQHTHNTSIPPVSWGLGVVEQWWWHCWCCPLRAGQIGTSTAPAQGRPSETQDPHTNQWQRDTTQHCDHRNNNTWFGRTCGARCFRVDPPNPHYVGLPTANTPTGAKRCAPRHTPTSCPSGGGTFSLK